MPHLDEEQLQRAAHGELAQGDAPARAHLAACDECRGRLDDATRDEMEVDALLRLLDHPAPAVTASTIAARARGVDAGWMRWAASIVVGLALAGAAYAAPGSPVPRWLARVATLVDARQARPGPVAPVPVAAAVTGGIAVAPGASLLILFTAPQAAGEARVSLTDSGEVVVRSIIGSATFTSGVDRLVIDNAGSSASYEIQIPRSAPRVEMRIGDRRILLKDGPRLTTATSAHARDPVILPLAP